MPVYTKRTLGLLSLNKHNLKPNAIAFQIYFLRLLVFQNLLSPKAKSDYIYSSELGRASEIIIFRL